MTPLEDAQLLLADVSEGWTTRGEMESLTLTLTLENTLDIHPPAPAAVPGWAFPASPPLPRPENILFFHYLTMPGE